MSDEDESVKIAKVPTFITFRDLILVLAAVISVVTAWSVHGTRLSIVEEKLKIVGASLLEIKQTIKDIRQDDKTSDVETQRELDGLETRLRRLEEQQARLEGTVKQRK